MGQVVLKGILCSAREEEEELKKVHKGQPEHSVDWACSRVMSLDGKDRQA